MYITKIREEFPEIWKLNEPRKDKNSYHFEFKPGKIYFKPTENPLTITKGKTFPILDFKNSAGPQC